MPRKFFRKYLPDHESVRANKWIARFGGFLHHPGLWALTRRSVAGGVAVGLFAGLVPGPLQMVTAALIAIPCKVNLPVALFITLYTNPITIVPLYLVAFKIGTLVTGAQGAMAPPPEFVWSDLIGSSKALGQWLVGLGEPLAIGLLALATGLAVTGYCVVQLGWRAQVSYAWRRRTKDRTKR